MNRTRGTGDFAISGFYHGLIKPDGRISIKDYRQNK